jgi:isoleucyl-tRNA synthetase
MPFKDVPQDVKFAEEEEKTLKYWDDIDAFQESLRYFHIL